MCWAFVAVLLAGWALIPGAGAVAQLPAFVLTVLLFLAAFSVKSTHNRALGLAKMPPGSRLTWLLKGTIRAIATSGAFALVTTIILIRLPTTTWEIAVALSVLFLVASGLMSWMCHVLKRDLKPPFVQMLAARWAAWIAALVAIPIVALIGFHTIDLPGQVSGDFRSFALSQIEEAHGTATELLGEAISALGVLDAAKIWTLFHIDAGWSGWAILAFAIESACICFAVSSVATTLTAWLETLLFSMRPGDDD